MNELFRTLLNLPPQASSVAFGIDLLHYTVIGISVIGAVGVAIVVAVLLMRFRRRPGGRAPARRGHVPLWSEILVIVGLLSMFLVFWAIGFRQFTQLRTPPADAITVYVVAKQWMWTFSYPDGTATTADLYVPTGRPVKLVMGSRDVIHSFFVPAFRIKQDVVPGRTTVAWFEATRAGTYDLLCTEYCGLEHSRMRGRVIALDDGAYARWADAHAVPAGSDLASTGERVAGERGCLRCHTVDGTPHLGPTFAGLYGSTIPLASGRRVIANEEYLTASMMDPAAEVHAGFAAIMPTYAGILSAPEVAALVEYIRSLAHRRLEPEPLPAAPLPPYPTRSP
jgi:cytochrome c oxidase subunit II